MNIKNLNLIYKEKTRKKLKSLILVSIIVSLFFFTMGVLCFLGALGFFSLRTDFVRPFLGIFSPILIILGIIFILGIISIKNLSIYKEGILLPYSKSFKDIFHGKNFVLFSNIKEIDMRDHLFAIFIKTIHGSNFLIEKNYIEDFKELKKAIKKAVINQVNNIEIKI